MHRPSWRLQIRKGRHHHNPNFVRQKSPQERCELNSFLLIKKQFQYLGWLIGLNSWMGLNSWVGPYSSPMIQFILEDLPCCTKKHWEQFPRIAWIIWESFFLHVNPIKTCECCYVHFLCPPPPLIRSSSSNLCRINKLLCNTNKHHIHIRTPPSFSTTIIKRMYACIFRTWMHRFSQSCLLLNME